MLSPEEKREMLEDARSSRRRRDFEQGHAKRPARISMDEYLSFLDNVQKIFSPFKISRDPTIAVCNKL